MYFHIWAKNIYSQSNRKPLDGFSIKDNVALLLAYCLL